MYSSNGVSFGPTVQRWRQHEKSFSQNTLCVSERAPLEKLQVERATWERHRSNGACTNLYTRSLTLFSPFLLFLYTLVSCNFAPSSAVLSFFFSSMLARRVVHAKWVFCEREMCVLFFHFYAAECSVLCSLEKKKERVEIPLVDVWGIREGGEWNDANVSKANAFTIQRLCIYTF